MFEPLSVTISRWINVVPWVLVLGYVGKYLLEGRWRKSRFEAQDSELTIAAKVLDLEKKIDESAAPEEQKAQIKAAVRGRYRPAAFELRWYQRLGDWLSKKRAASLMQSLRWRRGAGRSVVAADHSLSCLVISECPFLRVFGITEHAGTVRIVFWGGESSGSDDYHLFDVSISLVVSITNPVAANGLTDAVLVSRGMDPRAGPVATVAGRLTHTNRLLFERVPVHAPGKIGTWQLVIDRVRANTSQFKEPSADEIRAGRMDLLAFVSITPSETDTGLRAPIILGELCTTGRPVLPLYGRLVTLRSFRNFEDRNEHLAVDHLAHNALTSFLVELQETFLGAFGALHDEGAGATSGTRFLVRLEGIPASTAVFVTTRDLVNEGSGPSLTLIKGHDGNGAGGYRVPIAEPPGTGRTADGVPIDRIRELPDGTAFAVWEWTSPMDDSMERRKVQLGIVLAVAPGEIPEGGIEVRCGLAPFSSVTIASRSAPVPRFVPILVPMTGYFSFPL